MFCNLKVCLKLKLLLNESSKSEIQIDSRHCCLLLTAIHTTRLGSQAIDKDKYPCIKKVKAALKVLFALSHVGHSSVGQRESVAGKNDSGLCKARAALRGVSYGTRVIKKLVGWIVCDVGFRPRILLRVHYLTHTQRISLRSEHTYGVNTHSTVHSDAGVW